MSSKRALILLAGVMCCTAAIIQSEAEVAKEMYEEDHPDIQMFGYPAILRMPEPGLGFAKALPGVVSFLSNHLCAFYMDQVLMTTTEEEQVAFQDDPAVWIEVYDWNGDEETRIRVGPEWTESDIVMALSDVGVKPHPMLSRVLGYLNYVSAKTNEGRRTLKHVERQLLDEEGVLNDEEGEKLLEWREFLTETIGLADAIRFDIIQGDYAPWGALDRVRFFRDHRATIDEILLQVEELASQQHSESTDVGTIEKEEEYESSMENDFVESEGSDSDESFDEDELSAIYDQQRIMV